ncbi:MAG: hypothetical protein Q7U58_13360 [Hydrogenophaga sp.]|nr:hypothetical protein [Hydrogenophaga sp.]
MDLVSILATVILVTTIGTMIIGVGAYAAFKLRDKRKPKRKVTDELQGDKIINEPIFLNRYVPESISETSPDAS